jgi:glycosyltransferase involved in cell wall biosynthesis
MGESLSIVIPSKNEEKGLMVLLPKLQAQYPAAEIIVVDDGSADDTVRVCKANQVYGQWCGSEDGGPCCEQ